MAASPSSVATTTTAAVGGNIGIDNKEHQILLRAVPYPKVAIVEAMSAFS